MYLAEKQADIIRSSVQKNVKSITFILFAVYILIFFVKALKNTEYMSVFDVILVKITVITADNIAFFRDLYKSVKNIYAVVSLIEKYVVFF